MVKRKIVRIQQVATTKQNLDLFFIRAKKADKKTRDIAIYWIAPQLKLIRPLENEGRDNINLRDDIKLIIYNLLYIIINTDQQSAKGNKTYNKFAKVNIQDL